MKSHVHIYHTRMHTHTQIGQKPKSKFDQLSIALSKNTKKKKTFTNFKKKKDKIRNFKLCGEFVEKMKK